jgi:ABC-type branched-subunit amino acid transport system ATPase component
MDEHYYHVEMSAQQGVGIPQISANFGRITVLLGSNGTGKSRALRQIRDRVGAFGEPSRPVVYIEGGRVITIPGAISYDFNTFNEFGTVQRARNTFKSRRLAGMAARTRDAFYLLERRGVELKTQHSDAVSEWQRSGCSGECPHIEENPLDRLFKMFSEVFPEIAMRLEGDDNKQLICIKNSQPYPATELSDGERQVLFILADIALTAEPESLIIADEPELNLNPQLAGRLWDTIEARLPNAIFVYATHNISFAMRPSIECIIALSGRGQPAMQVDSVGDIDPADARDFLGAIPAILAAQLAVVVEGEESSFDSGFYKWVVGQPEVAVVPLGNCHEVYAATTRTGVWNRLASSVQLVGVVDRDYRDDLFLNKYQGTCLSLAYHEAESYLCHPTVFSAIARALGTAEIIPTEQEVAIPTDERAVTHAIELQRLYLQSRKSLDLCSTI